MSVLSRSRWVEPSLWFPARPGHRPMPDAMLRPAADNTAASLADPRAGKHRIEYTGAVIARQMAVEPVPTGYREILRDRINDWLFFGELVPVACRNLWLLLGVFDHFADPVIATR